MSKITMSCPSCGKVYTPDLCKQEDFDEKFEKWKYDGELIQNVWPDAAPFQREQLQTGICSDECWDKFLGVNDD